MGAGADNLGRANLFVLATAGGAAVSTTARLDRRVRDAAWFSDSTSIAINYWDGVDSPIARLNIRTGGTMVFTGDQSAARGSFGVSRSGVVAWSQSDHSSPSRIYLLRKNTVQLLVDLAPGIQKLRLGLQEVIRWKNHAGDDKEGILVKPVGYKEGQSYPLIVDVYPKLRNAFKGSPMMPGQAWASRGYAVFYPNGDGPHVWHNPWKSIADGDRAKGPNGIGIAVDDVMSGVDELIRRNIVDPNRMCLYGFSNGGGIVNQIVTKTSRFKCAISVAAAVSVDWTIAFLLYTDSRAISETVGTTPWESPQTYVDLSAIYRINKITTPMLLANGDDDGGGLLGEIEMYNALRYLGKDVIFLRYPRQGHGFEGAAMRDFWERENAFIDRYLRPSQSTILPAETHPIRSEAEVSKE